ncbi:MAG: hypothetical protein ABI680_08880 [Chthoniobacteraceae bacterium]
MENEPTLLWPKIAAFVRQHTHDLRNHLNGLDLEAALLSELVNDAEAVDSVKRMRAQVRKLASDLRSLSARFAEPKPDPTPFTAADFVAICEDQADSLAMELVVTANPPPETLINVDGTAISHAFREILANAKEFGEGRVSLDVTASSDTVSFAFREKCSPDVDPSCWGRIPFVSTKRGGYGLGLWEADRTIAANGGVVTRRVEPEGFLVTEACFPPNY